MTYTIKMWTDLTAKRKHDIIALERSVKNLLKGFNLFYGPQSSKSAISRAIQFNEIIMKGYIGTSLHYACPHLYGQRVYA